LTLSVGTYKVRFWYWSSGQFYPEKLEVKWGSAPNAASMTNGPVFDNNNITNSTPAEGIGYLPLRLLMIIMLDGMDTVILICGT